MLSSVALLLLFPLTAAAQTANGEPPPNVRMRIGPLFVNPTLALTNAGRDTNVFNDATNPKDDFTVTITPATDLWMRVGPSWLQSNIKEDLIWYQHYASERSANNSYAVRWVVPLNRLTLTPTFTYTNTRDRPSYEIDTRAERLDMEYGGMAEYRLFTKTFVALEARRQTTDFAQGSLYNGTDLHDELNRTGDAAIIDIRHQLTPLTAIVLSGALSDDRFPNDPLRNSDSRSVAAVIRFDPAALIKGSASFGYRDFKPRSPSLPAFSGATLNVNLNYVLLGITKFTITAVRDVQYSYDITQPYYLQTGAAASITQQVFGPVDVAVRGGQRQLQYRDRAGAVVAFANRVDTSLTYGGGIGYHLGRDMRIGVNADHTQRDSPELDHQFRGWTYGVSVTYGSGS